jgi:heterodisulfide reductase subunit C
MPPIFLSQFISIKDDGNMPVTVHYQAKDKLLQKYPKIEKCLKCNTCALVDPVAYAHEFSQTNTFVNNVFSASEPEKNPNIWLCVSCHKCEEICPYEVKPVEVIEGLKDEAFEKGYAPEFIREEINQVLTTGYAFPIFQSLNYINRMRNNLGLKSLGERKVADIARIAKKTGLESKMAGGKTR